MRHTSFEQVLAIAERLDARQPESDHHFEWYRENADHVVMEISLDGNITTWINDVEQETLAAGDYATARHAVLNLMNKDIIR